MNKKFKKIKREWEIDKPNKLFVDLYFLDVKNR